MAKTNSFNIFWHFNVCLSLTAVVLEVYTLLGAHGTLWQLTGAVVFSAGKRCEQVLLRCWHRLGSEYTGCFYRACHVRTAFYSNQHGSAVTGNTDAHTFAWNGGCSGSGLRLYLWLLKFHVVLMKLHYARRSSPKHTVCLISEARMQSRIISLFTSTHFVEITTKYAIKRRIIVHLSP